MNGSQAKVCLNVAIFKFKVALLDQVTQTVQTRLRSDRDYNTTIGSIRGYEVRSVTLYLCSGTCLEVGKISI